MESLSEIAKHEQFLQPQLVTITSLLLTGLTAVPFALSAMSQFGNIVGSGIGTMQSGLKLLAALNSALTCHWFPISTLIRFEVGKAGSITEHWTLFRSQGNNTIDNMKWYYDIKGAAFNRDSPLGQGRVETYVIVLLVKKPDFENIGEITFTTTQDLITLNRGNPGVKIQNQLVYNEKLSVINGRATGLSGWNDRVTVEGGFKNQSFPGPISLKDQDEICIVAKATDNFLDPVKTYSSVKARLFGTLTMSLAEIQTQTAVNEIT